MQGKWRNAGRHRSQTIPHGVSPLKSRLDAGHRAEPFPQGTVGPWKRWWCGGRPITGPYLLKGLPFPLVSCPHAKGRREVFPPRVTAVRAVLITCGIIQPSCSSEDPRLPTFHSQDLPTPGVGRVCGRERLTPDDNYCAHAEAAPGPTSLRLSIQGGSAIGSGSPGSAQFRHVGRASGLGSACGRQAVVGSDRCYIIPD